MRRVALPVAGLAALILAAAILLLAGAYFLAPRAESEIATITELNGALQWTGDGGR